MTRKDFIIAALSLTGIFLGACAAVPSYHEGVMQPEVLPGISAAIPVGAVRTSAVGLDSDVAVFEGANFTLVFDYGAHGALPRYGDAVVERVQLGSGITLDTARGSGGSERYPYGFSMVQVVEGQRVEDGGFGVPVPGEKFLAITGACQQQRDCEEIFDLVTSTLRVGR